MALTAIQAVGGIPSGVGMVRNPVNNIGMPAQLYGLIRRYQWAWWLSMAVGVGLVIWITTEISLLGYLPGAGIVLQTVFGLLGVAIIVLALVRPTRRFFRVGGVLAPPQRMRPL